jgi:hypothetical protein
MFFKKFDNDPFSLPYELVFFHYEFLILDLECFTVRADKMLYLQVMEKYMQSMLGK